MDSHLQIDRWHMASYVRACEQTPGITDVRERGEGVRRCEARGFCSRPDCRSLGATYAGPMSTLAWWLIPVGATLLAIGWAAFHSRPRKPAPAKDAMEGLRRFGDAMERPLPDYREGIDPPQRQNVARRNNPHGSR